MSVHLTDHRESMSMATLSTSTSSLVMAPEKDKCLFDIYKKEGDDFYFRRKYKKAMDSYSLALTHKKHDIAALVARSRCYLNMGLVQHALQDAETALDTNSSYTPAIYQKAQVLYRLGHYEMALLFFNKGRKLNPNAPGFLEGVEKAQKAISAVTPGRRMKTTEAGDLSIYIPRRPNFVRRFQPAIRRSVIEREPDKAPLSPSFRKRQMCKLVSLELQKKPPVTLDHFPQELQHDGRVRDQPGFKRPDRSAMLDVLSQLYTDKSYFEAILRDLEDSGRFDEDVFHIAGDGLAFIAERMLFWAEFGTRAPPTSELRKRRVSKQRKGLKPFASSRKEAFVEASPRVGVGGLTALPEGEVMTSSPRVDEGAETWGFLNEVAEANITAAQETDIKRRRKRRSERGTSRASHVSTGRKGKQRRRRRKRRSKLDGDEEEDEDLTAISPSEATRLEFKFDTYRPGTEEPSSRVPPLVRTKFEMSTDNWDSDTDCETDAATTARLDTERDLTTHRDLSEGEDAETEVASEDDVTPRAAISNDDLDDAWMYRTTGEKANADVGAKVENDPIKLYLIRATREIAQEFENEEYIMVRERVLSILTDLDKYKAEFMADKMGLVATLHSLLGNAYLELNDLDLALKHHLEDLRIGEERQYPNITSRSLGNVGRTHVFRKEYSKALEYFARKSNHVNTPTETAWLYHEMANCFLQLRHYEFCMDSAAKAQDAAREADSSLYLLQSTVLLAVSEVNLKKFDMAHDHFTQALDLVKLRDDPKAGSAIRNALSQVNRTLASQAKEKRLAGKTREETVSTLNSLSDDEDSELAPLRETDDESTFSEELSTTTAAAALATCTPTKTKQPTPPALKNATCRQPTLDLLELEKKAKVNYADSRLGRKSSQTNQSEAGSDGKSSVGQKRDRMSRTPSVGKVDEYSADKQSVTPRGPAPSKFARRPPAIIVPPPSKARLQKELELKKQREAMAAELKAAQESARSEDSGFNTFRSEGDEEPPPTDREEQPAREAEEDVGESKGEGKEEEDEGDLTKEMAVRFRSFVSEITPIREESYLSQRERTMVSEAPKTETVAEDTETQPEDTAETADEGREAEVAGLASEGDKTPEDEGAVQTEQKDTSPVQPAEPASPSQAENEGSSPADTKEQATTSEDSPKTPEDSPKVPEESPKVPEESPKTPEDSPKKPDDSPKTPEESSKIPEESQKTLHDSPKTPEDSTKTTEDSPKTPEASQAEKIEEPEATMGEKDTEDSAVAAAVSQNADEGEKSSPDDNGDDAVEEMRSKENEEAEASQKSADMETAGDVSADSANADNADHEVEKQKREKEAKEKEEREKEEKEREERNKAEKEREEREKEEQEREEREKEEKEMEEREKAEKEREEREKAEKEREEREKAEKEREEREKAEKERKEREKEEEGEEREKTEKEREEREKDEKEREEREKEEKEREERNKEEKEREEREKEEKEREMKELEEKEKAQKEREEREKEEKEREMKEQEEREKEEKEREMKEQEEREEKEREEKEKEEKEKEMKEQEEKEKAEKEKEEQETKEEEEEEKEEEPPKPRVDPILYNLAFELRAIEEAYNQEDAEGVMAKGKATLDAYMEEEVETDEYLPLVAKLHSFMGSSAIMLKDYDKALEHHKEDLNIGEKTEDEQVKARALENIGRVYVLKKDYEKGLESYVNRLKLERDDETSARVFHEIANCFFHMRVYPHARDSARLAVESAGKSGNSLIQLQSSVLLAVCHVKDKNNDVAYDSFESALGFAITRNDDEAEEAIRQAMNSLKNRRLKQEQNKDHDGRDSDVDTTAGVYEHVVLDRKAAEDLKPRKYDNFLDFGRMKKKVVLDEESPYKQHFEARRVSLKDVVNRYRYGRRMAGKFYPEDWVAHIANGKKGDAKRQKKPDHKVSKANDADAGKEGAEGEPSNEDAQEDEASGDGRDTNRTELHVTLPDAGVEADGSENGDEDVNTAGKEEAGSSPAAEPSVGTAHREENSRSELPAGDKADEKKHDEASKQPDQQSQPTQETAESPKEVESENLRSLIKLYSALSRSNDGRDDESEQGGMKVMSLPSRKGDDASETEDETKKKKRRDKGRVDKKKTKGMQHRRTGDPYLTVPKIP